MLSPGFLARFLDAIADQKRLPLVELANTTVARQTILVALPKLQNQRNTTSKKQTVFAINNLNMKSMKLKDPQTGG